jgi:hypothetical protein
MYRRAATALAGATVLTASLCAAPMARGEDDFAITAPVPTLDELNAQIQLLVASPAPDEVKAAQLEGGKRAALVPKMVYRLGFFRPPRGSVVVTGPETHVDGVHTAVINGTRAGAPPVQVNAEWRYIDQRWKLASKSMCSGIAALRLPIPCNFE